jgi:hypothetical protein
MLIRYFNSENSRWLFYAAVVFAIGFLNKYNVIFLLLGYFRNSLNPKSKSLGQKKFLSGDSCWADMILPNLIWQYANNFLLFTI